LRIHTSSRSCGINRLHKTRVEQAGFAVLKAPDIPSILVETAFISNPQEEKRLKRADYQEKMAAAIVAGIKKFFARNPPQIREKLALAAPVQSARHAVKQNLRPREPGKARKARRVAPGNAKL
jgi:hypothetical protein